LKNLEPIKEHDVYTFHPNNIRATERFSLACRDSLHSHTPMIHGVALLVVVLVTPSFEVLSNRAPDLDEPVTRALISQSRASLKGSREPIRSRRTKKENKALATHLPSSCITQDLRPFLDVLPHDQIAHILAPRASL